MDYAYGLKSNLLARRDVQYGETRILTSQQVYALLGRVSEDQIDGVAGRRSRPCPT